MPEVYIPLSGQQHKQLKNKMARMACAAYWRGKLEVGFTGQELESRLKKLVEENWTDWTDSAGAFLSMAYVIVKEQESEVAKADAFLQSLRERIADLEAQRKSASKAERLIINGLIGQAQAIIHDYERIKSE